VRTISEKNDIGYEDVTREHGENKNITISFHYFETRRYVTECICDNRASIRLDCRLNVLLLAAFALTFERFNRADQKKDSRDEGKREREREREREGGGCEKVRRKGTKWRKTTIAEVSVGARQENPLLLHCSRNIAASTLRAKQESLAQVRRDGEMARWRDGEMARWRDGEMARWRDGEMARWPGDEMAR